MNTLEWAKKKLYGANTKLHIAKNKNGITEQELQNTINNVSHLENIVKALEIYSYLEYGM